MARKDFSSALSFLTEAIPAPCDQPAITGKAGGFIPDDFIVRFPESASTVRSFNFERFYGVGCDEVTYYCHSAVNVLLSSAIATEGKTRSISTIITYTDRTANNFLKYCSFMASANKRETRLLHIDRVFVKAFIRYLEVSGVGYTTQKNIYTCCKAILYQLVQWGLLSNEIFPLNPFPHSNRTKKGAKGFSKREFTQVANALKSELVAIRNTDGFISAENLAFCAAAVATRTGLNLTPLIELTTDCLIPHPLRQDRSILITYKRRAHQINYQAFGANSELGGAEVDTLNVVMPDVRSIIEIVLERNRSIRESSKWPYRLFIRERPLKNAEKRIAAPLTINTINRALEALVEKHGLVSDDGGKLNLNISRLRKTFVNKVWELSGNDPFITAMLAGNTPKTLDESYLEAPADAEKNWALMGEIRNKEILDSVHCDANRIPVIEVKTPVAGCKDSLNGHRAPKNGSHCLDFLNCFRCRSFVVTEEDLYRLFSFYELLVRERGRMTAKSWSKLYRHIIQIIDEQIAPQFDAAVVQAARDRARRDPHPLWKDPQILELA